MAETDNELLSALSSFLERAQEEGQTSESKRETASTTDVDFTQRLVACERAVNELHE